MNESTNSASIQGVIVDTPVYSHSVKDEKFYTFFIKVDRLSNECDILPVIISSKLLSSRSLVAGEKVAIYGQFRSHNKIEDGKSKLLLTVFCHELGAYDENQNSNIVELSGYICKEPIYRRTPLNREICDLLIAVNRANNKSDYIPCLAWGRNARFTGSLPLGSKIELTGRIQSRKYNKKLESGLDVEKVAYEVSISNVAEIKNVDVS